MAREKIPEIYCWKIKSDDLNVYMASSDKGALRVGLDLKKGLDCVDFFQDMFPGNCLVKDEKMNHSLMKSLKAALKGKPFSGSPNLDIQWTPFQRLVLETVSRIPAGETRTYGEVAATIGSPRGARAVGQVMNRNPIPIIFP
jgi:O6-methylguanine-DNA--protein-cysteine methyltransferase